MNLCARILFLFLFFSVYMRKKKNCTKRSQVNLQVFLTHNLILICPPSLEASTEVRSEYIVIFLCIFHSFLYMHMALEN